MRIKFSMPHTRSHQVWLQFPIILAEVLKIHLLCFINCNVFLQMLQILLGPGRVQPLQPTAAPQQTTFPQAVDLCHLHPLEF